MRKRNEEVKRKRSVGKILMGSLFVLFLCVVFLGLMGSSSAKSCYVVADINAYQNIPIQAYDMQSGGVLSWQATQTIPDRDGGAVGIAIDTDSEVLFITFEQFSTYYDAKIDIVYATNMTAIGQVTAPGAHNLAGIVVDQDNQKVYCVDRNTNNLYSYTWDASTLTLTNDLTSTPYYTDLEFVSMAHGIALDEVNDLLYVGDRTTSVKVFDTDDWSHSHNVTFTSITNQTIMGVALDVKNGYMYCGNAYPGYGSVGLLTKYDLNTDTESYVNVRELTGHKGYAPYYYTADNVLGLAVDPDTGVLYITTGNQGSGGSDQLMSFDSDLNLLYTSGDIGNPTDLTIPGKDVSYNPLDLTKEDGLTYPTETVSRGADLTYTITYDNSANDYDVTNVLIVDTLSDDVTYKSCTGGGVYEGLYHTVTWDIGDMDANEGPYTVTLTVTVNSDAPQGGDLDNAIVIDSDQTPTTTKHEYTRVSTNEPPVADANGPYTVDEGTAVTFDASGSTDPDSDALTYRWDFDNDGNWDTAWSSSPTASHTWDDDYTGTVVVEVSDGLETDTATASVTVNNVDPTITGITVSTELIPIDTGLDVEVTFTDPGDDEFTADFDWGDTTSDLTDPATSPESETHSYTTPGVYTITVTVEDDDGGSDTEEYPYYIIVYDPNDGFVTGGGWIDSPAGSFAADEDLTGKANFGFVCKYQKGKTVPKGNTEFQFHAGDLNFHSSSFDWLVIANAKAQFKGSGTINGVGDYGFMITAIDGKLKPTETDDTFRIKIWDKTTDDVIYDNKMGAEQTADPTTILGGGNIVIHKA